MTLFDDRSLSAAGIKLAAATYNIHRCFGTDGRYGPERIAEVLRALDADVLGLQEIDMKLLVDGRTQLDYFAETLGMHAVAGPNIKGRRGKFGNALLSRWPVALVRRVDFTVGHFEPRGALDCELQVGSTRVRAVVTHLGLSSAERRHQVAVLLDALAGASDGMPTVVMGDFNEWRPTRGALRHLDRRLGTSLMPRTFPSRLPILPLDRIWVWPEPGLARLSVHAAAPARVASDHLPLKAEVHWHAIGSETGMTGGFSYHQGAPGARKGY
ncbi:MAG: endonuclease/exonuclease/phosphatase family protein [Actinomycetota bacterium]